MSRLPPALVQESHAVLATHARTFTLASWFLPSDRRDDAAVLYALCRLVDDLADETGDDAALQRLADEVSGVAEPRPLVAAFHVLVRERGVQTEPMLALIEGVRSDLDTVRFADDRTLLRYCYRVAGTVGLLMCPILGVHDPAAHAHAVDLGVAMQLTNICRDVLEDAERGRVYLPEARLRAAGTNPDALLAGAAPRDAVARVVLDLLDLAEQYYASGIDGLPWIPWRPRLAIRVAARTYRAIGVRLARHGGDALAGRTIVPWSGKLVSVGTACLEAAVPASRGHHDPGLHELLAGLPGTDARGGA